MSKKETISDTKHPTKSFPAESNVSSQKKSKKPRKSHKIMSPEAGVMKSPEEIINVVPESTFENFQNQESIIEPTRNFYQETANTDVENLFSNNESDIEALKIQINNYSAEIKTLKIKLEEANEKIASYENQAESLSEEIRIIKAKLVDAERSKSKIEEQLKQTENSISNSSTKTVELERKLAQNNAENNDLKLKVDFLNSELKSEQEKLKIEQEKYKSAQEKLKSEEEKLKSAQDKLKSEEEKLKSAHDKLKSAQEKLKSEQEKLKSAQEKLKSEQEKLKSLEKEKAEINEINETNNVNHIKMYQQYERKIEKLTGDHKLVKNETVRLNSLLHEKEENMIKLNQEIEQLNIKLGDSKKENESICIKLEEVTRELSESAVEATESNKDYQRLSENLESLKLEIGNKENNYESQIQKLSEEIKENLLHFEEEKIVLKQEIMRLNSELSSNCKEKEKTESLSNTLKSYADEIDQLKKSNSDILLEMNTVKIEFSQKTEELKIKAQECLEKDARLKEIHCDNSELKSEIERLRSEISANFDITIKNSNLIEEISLLKSASCNKDDELNMRLNNTLKELKQKSNDLTVLQDQKVDQLKAIEQLKKDLSSKIEKIAELTNDVATKEIVIKELINEKKNLESKLESVRKTVEEKEIQLQNSKVVAKHEESEEILKQLEMKNNEIMKLENEKVQFLQDIDRMKHELKRNEEYTKLQIFNLQGHLDEKIHELNSQNDAYLSIKDKFDALEQKLSDSVVTKSLEAQFSEEKIEETRLQPDFQICEKSMIITSESRTIEEMQSHIDKLQSELLVLQRKYYELKDASVSHESNLKNQQIINIYPTDIVSIPPTTPEITTSDIHTDKSQSHSHLLESIEKLNMEISEQRLKNQTLDKQFFDKNNEVNALKQCLFGLDGDLLSIEHLALDLQKSFSDSYSEKNRLKSDYNRLSDDYETVKVKYENLVKEFEVLKSSSQTHDTSETITLLEDQLKKCQDDNCQLKIQLESYRETLEKTENCLQNIQASVDQEESNWKICLKSSEQEQERLEEKIKELLNQIEDLRNQKHSDSSVMISMETPSIANGSLSSETKKKRKRKNKKKKNKNRVTQP